MRNKFIINASIYILSAIGLWHLYQSILVSIPQEQAIWHEVGLLVLYALIIPSYAVMQMKGDYLLRAKIVRFLLLGGIGVVVCDIILPELYEQIIRYLHYVKVVTIVPGLIMEFFVAVAIYRVAFSRDKASDNVAVIEREYGVPTWLAKAFVAEAKFWQFVYRLIFRQKAG